MILQAYQHLVRLDASKLGAELPKLSQGSLVISSRLLSYAELQQQWQGFNPTQGWVMARGEVTRSTTLPGENDLLEAECSKGNNSLQVRLEQPGVYRCTVMQAADNGDMVYRDQQVHSRESSNLQLVYRLWWQLGSDAYEGRYRPLAQQFIGFYTANEAEAS